MSAEFKYKNPLTLETGTGITGSINGENLTSREIQGLVDENVVISVGQVVETTSNTTFNNVTSSNVLQAGNLFLGDGFISSSNSVVAHTGSVVVTGNTTLPSMTINGELNAPDFEVSVTGSTTLFDSGSSRFGDTLDDTHNLSGSSNITGSFGLNGANINEISNDTALADASSTAIATENAIKQYFIDTGIVDKNTYNRKSFVHTGSFTSANTSSFTAVTASAPTGLSGTTEEDFMFFINGMLIENDALTIVQKTLALGPVTGGTLLTYGAGHTNGAFYNMVGGSGTGFQIRGVGSGGMIGFTIAVAGTGYQVGDIVSTPISNPATLEIIVNVIPGADGSEILELRLNTSELGYELESDDEVIGFGKFNS